MFKTGHHETFVLDWKLLVSDVAMATSATPTYFPAHSIGAELYADGGLFANSPDLIALHEAEEFLRIPRERVSILSVGTTTTDFAMTADMNPNLGSFGWMRRGRLPNVMIGSQQAITNDMMVHRLKDRYPNCSTGSLLIRGSPASPPTAPSAPANAMTPSPPEGLPRSSRPAGTPGPASPTPPVRSHETKPARVKTP